MVTFAALAAVALISAGGWWTTRSTPPPVPSTSTSVPPVVSGGGCAAYPAFPDASCTGWQHTGVTLRTVKSGDSGPGWHVGTAGGNEYFYVTTPGAVIDGLDIDMCVSVMADNVTIQRSRIRCDGYYVVKAADLPTTYRGLSLIDDELDGLGNPASESIAVMATEGAHYLRLNVHGMPSSGPRLATDNLMEDSWLHDFACASPLHQAGTSANDGGSNIVVRHNTIDIDPSGGCATAAFELALDFGTYNGVTVEKNLLNGGNYCAYAGINVPGASYPAASNVSFLSNVFGRKYSPDCGAFGPIVEWGNGAGNTWSGNTWGPGAAADNSHNTGDPVTPGTHTGT